MADVREPGQDVEKMRQMEVVNFVYRLSQTVKRLRDGRAVCREELDRLHRERPVMRLAAHGLKDVYPDLPDLCDRMCLRLQMLLGEGRAPRAWEEGRARRVARPLRVERAAGHRAV